MTQYAIIENSRTGKIERFTSQEAFVSWARTVEHPIIWDFMPDCFIYDIFGDRNLAEHMISWRHLADLED